MKIVIMRSIAFTGMRLIISSTRVLCMKFAKNCMKLSVWTVMEYGVC